jgi:VWFA-related protein
VTLVAGVVLLAAASVAQERPIVRTVHLSVVDSGGAPVAGLGPADFEVRENGQLREVFNAQPAQGRIDIALLVDDNGTGINDIRRGMAAFMQRVYQNANISIVTTAGQNVTVLDYTADPREMQAGINQLVGRPAPRGGHLIDGIYEAARGLQEREGGRRAIVVLTFEGEEFSDTPENVVLDRLRDSRTVLHVIAVGQPALRAMNPLTDGPRDNPVETNFSRARLLSEGTKRSGGRYEEMVVTAGVPDVMAAIADELANQYVVSYLLPPGVEPSERLEVRVNRPRVAVRSPTRIPD